MKDGQLLDDLRAQATTVGGKQAIIRYVGAQKKEPVALVACQVTAERDRGVWTVPKNAGATLRVP